MKFTWQEAETLEEAVEITEYYMQDERDFLTGKQKYSVFMPEEQKRLFSEVAYMGQKYNK